MNFLLIWTLWTIATVVDASSSLRKCVFIHGVGGAANTPATSSDTKNYWGGDDTIKPATHHLCDSYVFLHMNTVSNGWDNMDLQETVCNAAVGDNDGAFVESSSTISSTVVFSHSMGNLIFAGALSNKVCTLGKTSDWVSISAPWDGSSAADWVTGVCKKRGLIPKILEPLAKELRYCKPDGTGVNFAYVALSTDYPGILSGNLRRTAERYASASLCGTSAWGVTSKFSLALKALATVSNYGQKNDGMVGVSSCKLRDRIYSTEQYNTNYYLPSINHADATLRTRDGGKGTNSPFAWISQLQLTRDDGHWLYSTPRSSYQSLADVYNMGERRLLDELPFRRLQELNEQEIIEPLEELL